MSELGAGDFATILGLWVGFLFSIMIFTAITGDHALAQLAQHILVGVSLGYLAILVLRHVLQPWLFTPLLTASTVDLKLWMPLGLGVLLFIAGLDRMLDQNHASAYQPGWGRRLLHGLGLLPAGLLLGVTLAVVLIGVVQGSLIPQFWRAAQTELTGSAAVGQLLTNGLTLLLTTATLLYLSVGTERHLQQQPARLRRILAAWIWLGERALWVAAGIIFARLIAARLSLLIGRLEFFLIRLNDIQLWQWAEDIWQRLVG